MSPADFYNNDYTFLFDEICAGTGFAGIAAITYGPKGAKLVESSLFERKLVSFKPILQ